MSGNAQLSVAKQTKNDEFYTQFGDIQNEMNAYYEYDHDVFRGKTILLPCDDPEWSNFTRYFATNFERFGIKKLISTSYAKGIGNKQTTLLESNSPHYSKEKHDAHGKLFILQRDVDGSGNIDTDDIEFTGYLKDDGDFRSDEVTKLRDEADIIITNPPFSLFKEFINWILEGDKKFIILGNKNAITYKEIFPLIKENRIWLGYTPLSKDIFFKVPEEYGKWMLENKKEGSTYRIVDGTVMGRASACWFTNEDHGRRHELLTLDTMEHNLKFNKKLRKNFEKEYGVIEYKGYDNYDALEVPYVECIPSDYDGMMGVPISFMDKYNPDQFEIMGMCENLDLYGLKTKTYTSQECKDRYFEIFGKKGTYDLNASGVVNGMKVYQRILVRRKGDGSGTAH